MAPTPGASRVGASNLGLGARGILRGGIAHQHLRARLDLPGISAVGIPALVPFRDRIARTRDRRSAGAVTDTAMGRGARLRRDAGGARDRHPPWRIRARRAATYRGDTIDNRRLVRLAAAISQSGMTATIRGSSSRSQPKSLVNIEFYRTLVTHLQK